MSMTMEDDIKRWTAKRKAALVIADLIGFYNQRRPHQALWMKTPAMAYQLAA